MFFLLRGVFAFIVSNYASNRNLNRVQVVPIVATLRGYTRVRVPAPHPGTTVIHQPHDLLQAIHPPPPPFSLRRKRSNISAPFPLIRFSVGNSVRFWPEENLGPSIGR
jgi:hypothetical protein